MTTLDELSELRAEHESFPARRAVVVEKARAEGMTWLQIADALGMTQHGLIKAHARITQLANVTKEEK